MKVTIWSPSYPELLSSFLSMNGFLETEQSSPRRGQVGKTCLCVSPEFKTGQLKATPDELVRYDESQPLKLVLSMCAPSSFNDLKLNHGGEIRQVHIVDVFGLCDPVPLLNAFFKCADFFDGNHVAVFLCPPRDLLAEDPWSRSVTSGGWLNRVREFCAFHSRGAYLIEMYPLLDSVSRYIRRAHFSSNTLSGVLFPRLLNVALSTHVLGSARLQFSDTDVLKRIVAEILSKNKVTEGRKIYGPGERLFLSLPKFNVKVSRSFFIQRLKLAHGIENSDAQKLCRLLEWASVSVEKENVRAEMDSWARSEIFGIPSQPPLKP